MTDATTVFLFSGQGSHHFQMGRALFDRNAVFRDCMRRLDVLVQDLSGHSVIDALYFAERSRSESFDRIALSHPAIFMVEYSLAQTLQSSGIRADLTLGASLGSFAAATIAGLVTVEDALTAVVRQASTLEEHCETGAMFAVLADPVLHEDEFLGAATEVAAVNFATHFVLSAPRHRSCEVESHLAATGVAFQRLPVSYAFHSQWIDGARQPLTTLARSVPRKIGQLPLVCCEQAAILTQLSDDYFWRVVRRPIRFREAIALLEREGSYRYIDVGPAGTLATFLKYGIGSTSRSTVQSVLTPYGHDERNLSAVLASGFSASIAVGDVR